MEAGIQRQFFGIATDPVVVHPQCGERYAVSQKRRSKVPRCIRHYAPECISDTPVRCSRDANSLPFKWPQPRLGGGVTVG
jgi:hypothetical protein